MTHLDEERQEDVDTCADCGGRAGRGERTFAVDDDSVLCFACAMRRGGSYDERHDTWSTEPEIDDLLERDRPH